MTYKELVAARAYIASSEEVGDREKQGVIAVILRPSDDGSNTYTFYVLDHNHYAEQSEDKIVHRGIGLFSETMKQGEGSADYLSVMARGYVEELMGISDSDPSFPDYVVQARGAMAANLQELGSFIYDFEYTIPNREPILTRGHVHVFRDDNKVMDVGEVNRGEIAYAGYLGAGDLDHNYALYRTGYDTRTILGSAELQDILMEHAITIEA